MIQRLRDLVPASRPLSILGSASPTRVGTDLARLVTSKIVPILILDGRELRLLKAWTTKSNWRWSRFSAS